MIIKNEKTINKLEQIKDILNNIVKCNLKRSSKVYCLDRACILAREITNDLGTDLIYNIIDGYLNNAILINTNITKKYVKYLIDVVENEIEALD